MRVPRWAEVIGSVLGAVGVRDTPGRVQQSGRQGWAGGGPSRLADGDGRSGGRSRGGLQFLGRGVDDDRDGRRERRFGGGVGLRDRMP